MDWALEILQMKKRLGMEHVGLGTDGGGGLPAFIKGYSDLRDLRKLANAMENVGLSDEDITAYMGENLYRLLQSVLFAQSHPFYHHIAFDIQDHLALYFDLHKGNSYQYDCIGDTTSPIRPQKGDSLYATQQVP